MELSLETRAHDALLRYHFPGMHNPDPRTLNEEFRRGFVQGHMVAELAHRESLDTQAQKSYE